MSLNAGGGATKKKPSSRRILESLVNTVQFRTGINVHVFRVLKDSVQKMSDKDRMCCLMFDEMSVSIRIAIRRLTVLKALRTFEATASNITNHAPVFMVHALRKC